VKAGLVVALLLAFASAEAFGVVHAVDLKAHQSGDLCKICLSAASLGAASLGQIDVFVPERALVPLYVPPPTGFVSARLPRESARGPPFPF
jgi:hypothetical protein